MKKAYITPEMEIINIETEALMLTASAGTEFDTSDDAFNQRSTGRRGTWGNLWYTEQE